MISSNISKPSSLDSNPQPVKDYQEAVRRFDEFTAAESSELNPVCRSRLLTHGRRVDRAVVLLHGLTSCPAQYARLAPMFHNLGYNVLVPQMPRHGLSDRLTDILKHLKAEELRVFSDMACDLAQGLGHRVTVVGLSAGGMAAGWVAQHRRDVEQAVLISPAFGIGGLGRPLNALYRKIFLKIPNVFMWSHPVLKERRSIPPYQYLRHSSRAVAEMVRLGREVIRAAPDRPPAVRTILVITNAGDSVVDNSSTRYLIRLWRSHPAVDVITYEFSAELKLPHDLISPEMRGQNIDLVYSTLLDLMARC